MITRHKPARTVSNLRREDDSLRRSLRALGHDMTANFMLLESSFRQLEATLGRRPDDACRELVAHIEACLGESKRFLGDLRTLAKTGGFEMEPGRVDLDAVVEEVLFEQRELLENRGVEVDVRSPLAAVWCNRQRAKQVVTNLVRNAALHGCDAERPGISISTSWTPAGRKNASAMVTLRVHDNGPGIDPAFAEEIFLAGRRLAGRSTEGSGMGLAIVRDIAEHYGGTARVDLDCKSGTAVEASLPAARDVHPLSRPHWELSTPSRPSSRMGETDGTHPSPPSPPSRGHRSKLRRRQDT